ncbi:uncharacterized protein LOC108045990 isoform X1 [Drosophila rhopaloa]|uniref:Uncharacterized protein n=1 Tax=Drosophila rhopaloa TaxID=1041015 RepID=A0ABM5HIS4_DRORH|nr:uncharacterized protein LOC108045990 isoform X1 [Drosophila rhopaloa]
MPKLHEQRKSNEEIKGAPTPTPKSSIASGKKKPYHAFRNISKLKFTTNETLPISARDYGLMRSTNKSSTPYPRAEQGVDASLLKARLTMRKDFENRLQTIHSNHPDKQDTPSASDVDSHSNERPAKVKSSVTVFRRESLTKDNYKEMLSLGTPHPIKGVALSARLLTRRLTDINDMLKQQPEHSPQPVATQMRTRNRKVIMSSDPESRDSIIPPENPSDGELVSKNMSSRLTQVEYDASFTSMSGDSLQPQLSFAERRRLFNEGEFTIAKYGRKMSDVMMASTPQQHQVVDNSFQFAKKANDELEKYMISQGLIKTSHDQVTMTRHFGRPSDVIEAQGENDNKQNSKKKSSVNTGPHKEFL